MTSVLNHPLITSGYFFPRKDPLPNPFWVDCDGARLSCHRDERHPDAFTLLHFHGNGETAGDYVNFLADAFLDMGVNVCFAEYRGYGASSGRPELAAMLDDTACIVKALGLPEEKIIVYGRSVGSIYAIECAARHPHIAGLIIESGIADPLERLLLRVSPTLLGVTLEELGNEVSRLLDHRRKLALYNGPLLIMHTEHDHIVDRSHADRMEAWSASTEKRKHIFGRGDHNTIFGANLPEYLDLVRAFITARRGR